MDGSSEGLLGIEADSPATNTYTPRCTCSVFTAASHGWHRYSILVALVNSIVTFSTYSLAARLEDYAPNDPYALTVSYTCLGVGKLISSISVGISMDKKRNISMISPAVRTLSWVVLAIIGFFLILMIRDVIYTYIAMALLGVSQGCITEYRSAINKNETESQKILRFTILPFLYQSMMAAIINLSWFLIAYHTGIYSLDVITGLQFSLKTLGGISAMFVLVMVLMAGYKCMNRLSDLYSHGCKKINLHCTTSVLSSFLFALCCNILIPTVMGVYTIISTKELNSLVDVKPYNSFLPSKSDNTTTGIRYELNYLFNFSSQALTCFILLLLLTLTSPSRCRYWLKSSACLPLSLGILLVLSLIVVIPVEDPPPDRIAMVGLLMYAPLLQVFKVFRDYTWAKNLNPESSGRSNGLLQAIQTALKTISVPLMLLLYTETGYVTFWCITFGAAVTSVTICITWYLLVLHRSSGIKDKLKHIWTKNVGHITHTSNPDYQMGTSV